MLTVSHFAGRNESQTGHPSQHALNSPCKTRQHSVPCFAPNYSLCGFSSRSTSVGEVPRGGLGGAGLLRLPPSVHQGSSAAAVESPVAR